MWLCLIEKICVPEAKIGDEANPKDIQRHHVRKRGMGQPLLFSVLILKLFPLRLHSADFENFACNFVMEPA